MSPVAQSVLFFLLAGVVFLAAATLLAAGVGRAIAQRVVRFEPGTRHRLLVLLACLPLLLAFVLLLSASLPSLFALAMPSLDHCLTHDDGHAHLCFVHLPRFEAHLPVVLGLTLLASYAGVRALLTVAKLVRASRVLRTLTRTGEARADLGVTLLESSTPMCVTAGLLQPSVLISRGLFELLSDDERTIVFAHEHAHARRKDALVANLTRICCAAHLPSLRRWIVRELEIAAEQVCDEEAGLVVGDRTAVAAAIVTVGRATQRARMGALEPVAVGVGMCAVERRVHALLADPLVPASWRPIYVTLGCVVVALLAGSKQLHHATEALLSMLVH